MPMRVVDCGGEKGTWCAVAAATAAEDSVMISCSSSVLKPLSQSYSSGLNPGAPGMGVKICGANGVGTDFVVDIDDDEGAAP